MIPLIGLMIGAYIITRMIELINNKETVGFVAICGGLTIVIVLFCLAGLLMSSAGVSTDSLNLPSAPRMQGIPGQS